MPKEKIVLSTFEDTHVEAEVGWAGSEVGHVSLYLASYEDQDGRPSLKTSVHADDLSYQGINALIRYLRRARDSAYGKPE